MQLLDLLLPTRCVVCGQGEEVLCAGCLVGLRRIRGPDVRPVRGANRVAGVPLLRVCGAACRLRDRQSGGGLRRAHATARGGLEGAGAPLPDGRGRGPRRGSRAATARSRTRARSRRSRPDALAGPGLGRSRSQRRSRSAGTCRSFRSSGVRGGPRDSAGSTALHAGRTSVRPSEAPVRSRPGSGSSTTSTRPARPYWPPRRSSAGPAPAKCTSSRSRGRSVAEDTGLCDRLIRSTRRIT